MEELIGWKRGRPADSPYRDAYPGLNGMLFPNHQFPRLQWAKLMTKTLPYRIKTTVGPRWRVEEWVGSTCRGSVEHSMRVTTTIRVARFR